MSGTSIKLKFPVARRNVSRRSRKAAMAGSPSSSTPVTKPVSKVARMLALAHHIERAIEGDVIRGNADAARALGLSRARMTQIMNLLLLAPEIQACILTGKLVTTEHDLRHVVRVADWKTQTEALELSRAVQTKPSGEAAKKRKLS